MKFLIVTLSCISAVFAIGYEWRTPEGCNCACPATYRGPIPPPSANAAVAPAWNNPWGTHGGNQWGAAGGAWPNAWGGVGNTWNRWNASWPNTGAAWNGNAAWNDPRQQNWNTAWNPNTAWNRGGAAVNPRSSGSADDDSSSSSSTNTAKTVDAESNVRNNYKH